MSMFAVSVYENVNLDLARQAAISNLLEILKSRSTEEALLHLHANTNSRIESVRILRTILVLVGIAGASFILVGSIFRKLYGLGEE